MTFAEVNHENASSVYIEELSIQGTILQQELLNKQAKWRGKDDDSTKELLNAPLDYLKFQGVALEPQKIRTFLISYNLPDDKIKEKDLRMHQARVEAGLEKEYNLTANETNNKLQPVKKDSILMGPYGKPILDP